MFGYSSFFVSGVVRFRPGLIQIFQRYHLCHFTPLYSRCPFGGTIYWKNSPHALSYGRVSSTPTAHLMSLDKQLRLGTLPLDTNPSCYHSFEFLKKSFPALFPPEQPDPTSTSSFMVSSVPNTNCDLLCKQYQCTTPIEI